MTAPKKLFRKSTRNPRAAAVDAMYDIINFGSYDELDAVQRIAHLAYWYDCELQNGGHLQYFHNHGLDHVDEAIDSLRIVGALSHGKILSRAAERMKAIARPRAPSLEEYGTIQELHEFADLDSEYSTARPEMLELLSAYCKSHEASFVEWVE